MKNLVIATTDSYKHLPLERALEGLSRVGFTQIELLGASEWTPHYDPSTASAQDRARLITSLERYGLRIASISGHSNLASDEGLRKFRDRLEFAVSLGVRIVNTGVGDLSSEERRQRFQRNIREVAAWASGMGVTVALEPHGAWAPSGRVLAKMIRELGAPSVRINYDTANVIYYSGERPEEDLPSAVDLVAHVHMKDKIGGKMEWNFPALGKGEIDFSRILAALERGHYGGPLSIEIELTPETERNADLIDQAFRDSLAYLRSLNRLEHLPGAAGPATAGTR
jgi:sugar phosphate isomerase/epimerase